MCKSASLLHKAEIITLMEKIKVVVNDKNKLQKELCEIKKAYDTKEEKLRINK